MLRSALLWASTNPYLAKRLPRARFVQRATRRFLPGERLEDALDEARRLQAEGAATAVTLLGENVETPADADAVTDHYVATMATIRAAGLDTEISVKLTQLGLDLDQDAATQRLERLVRACESRSLVWVDMESSAYVDRTLEIFRAVREDHQNVGICLQTYLRRTQADLEELIPLHPAIRLVKGAYKESPEVAFARKAEVDQNFIHLTSALLRARKEGRVGRPVIGTHDSRVVGEANRMAYELGLPKEGYEIAMLYGIGTAEQERLVRSGYTLRVLICYGSHWFPWYMRRLAERPANVWFVLKQLVR